MSTFSSKFGKDRPWGGKRRQTISFRRAVSYIIAIVGGMALCGILLLVCSLIKVSSLSVSGANMIYESNYIAEASGIEVGGDYYGFDPGVVEDKLRRELPYLKNVTVRRHLGAKVSITVEEESSFYYTRHNVNYYLISADTHRVILADSNAATFIRLGAVYIGLPQDVRIRVGEKLAFEYATYVVGDETVSPDETREIPEEPADEKYEYVFEFVNAVMESEISDKILGIDASDEYALFVILKNNVKISFGSTYELERKLSSAKDVLDDNIDTVSAEGFSRAVIEASDPAKITFREDPTHDFPDWAKGE